MTQITLRAMRNLQGLIPRVSQRGGSSKRPVFMSAPTAFDFDGRHFNLWSGRCFGL